MLANFYIRTILGLHVRDCNSGFRCFKRRVLENVDMNHFVSEGPAIVQELLYKAFLKGFVIAEVPITFKEREEGNSKFGLKSLYKGYGMVLTLKLQKLLGRL
jgi:dolichol-phosphate mannosyltransferase